MTTKRTLCRVMPDRSFVVAELEVRQPGGRFSPGYSLVGEVYEPHGTWSGEAQWRNGREPDSCGQVTDDMLRAFPWLAPFARAHLSGLDGTPMHAEANALYWLREGNREYAESTLRATIPAAVVADDGTIVGPAWQAFMGDLREQWAYDAWDASRVFDRLA